MNLQGKVAVVTGGGRGIGRAIVEQLAAEGAAVVFGDLKADNVRDLAASLRDKGLAVEGAVSDVANKGEIESLIDSAVAANGHLDIMVNCAGINRSIWSRLSIRVSIYQRHRPADQCRAPLCTAFLVLDSSRCAPLASAYS